MILSFHFSFQWICLCLQSFKYISLDAYFAWQLHHFGKVDHTFDHTRERLCRNFFKLVEIVVLLVIAFPLHFTCKQCRNKISDSFVKML